MLVPGPADRRFGGVCHGGRKAPCSKVARTLVLGFAARSFGGGESRQPRARVCAKGAAFRARRVRGAAPTMRMFSAPPANVAIPEGGTAWKGRNTGKRVLALPWQPQPNPLFGFAVGSRARKTQRAHDEESARRGDPLRVERRAQIVRPDQDGQNTLPEREAQIADGEQPRGTPHQPPETLLLNSDFVHARQYTLAPATR